MMNFLTLNRSRPRLFRLEQAVYGSFAFRAGGYDVLASSKGCAPEWLLALRAACERFGERPRGADEPGGIFSLRVDRATRMVVAPADQGADDQGRPGALAFHAVFLSQRDERRMDFDPFALAPFFRRSWSSDTPRELPSLAAMIAPPAPLNLDDRARSIVRLLRKGKRAAIAAKQPIDDLARTVWMGLPRRDRRAKSFATWSYSLANRYDLVALPDSSPELLDVESGYITV